MVTEKLEGRADAMFKKRHEGLGSHRKEDGILE